MAEKYVIFKIADWEAMIEAMGDPDLTLPHPLVKLERRRITDGTVIRTQDSFAASGFQGYADSIATAIDVVYELVPLPLPDKLVERIENMRVAADHFHEQAEIARDTKGKVPD